MVRRLLIGVWACGVAVGFGVWEATEATPGKAGRTPPAAPAGRRGPSVVVFVHPHCPCTRAVLPELVAALAAAPPGAEARVVFVRPAGVPDGWERSPSWAIAAGAGVDVRSDPDGVEAAAEGAETSGYAVARDARGTVAFRGGVSRPRTRGVRDPGLRAIADVLAGRAPVVEETAVYGCLLRTP